METKSDSNSELIKELRDMSLNKKKLKETETHDKEGNPHKKYDGKENFDKLLYHLCKTCNYVKKKDYFVKDKQVAAGVRNICKFCKNKKLREVTKSRKELENKKE